jgi:hypothetical protein
MAETFDPIKTTEYAGLLKNIKERITEAQYEVFKSINKELIALYWGYWANDCGAPEGL